MAIQRLSVLSAVIVVALTSSSYAGPCSGEIERMQASIDAKLNAKAEKGASEKESPGALMHRQPTPGSIAAAEQKLGEASAKTSDAVAQAMARARAADSAGDKNKCEEALAEAGRAIGQ
jgi:hypothetical protein